MKKLLKGLGLDFSKADEMEQSIQLQSIRMTWLYSVVFLAVWSIYECTAGGINNGRVNFLPPILLFSQAIVMYLSRLLYRADMTKGTEDDEKKNQFRITLLIIAILVAIGAATAAIAYYIAGYSL
jgi:uncharacterized membrane protein